MSFNLGRALEDLAESGASRRTADDDALSSRVNVMASRIRRRRALRYTGTTAVAACAVGALAVGLAYLPGLLGDGRSGPAVSPTDPAPSTEPSPAPTLVALSPELACGATLASLGDQGLLSQFIEIGERTGPGTDDAGVAAVMGVAEDANGAAVELEYYLPGDSELSELGWTVLVLDDENVVVGVFETGVGPVTPEAGVTSVGTTTTLPTESCADGSPLVGNFMVVGVADAAGTKAGASYVERAASEIFTVELGGDYPAPDDPMAETFTCDAPGPESIHTLPDAQGITLAVDLPASPWTAGALPQIPGFLGTADGRSIIANVPLGVAGALVDSSGDVVGFVLPDATDVQLVELTPESTSEIVLDQSLVMCGADGSLSSRDDVNGTFILWPFMTASLKEIVDSDGNAISSSETVLVVANPQEVTITP